MKQALFASVALALVVAGCAREMPEGVTVLTYATAYAPSHPFSRADQVWIDHVAEASGGRIVIRPYWAGSLLSEAASMEEIRHGVADIGLITPIYALGGAHLLRTQSGFYSGITGYEHQTELFRCMEAAGDPFAEELEGLKILALQGGNNPGIITRGRAVGSLSDLNGMRIRAPSELLPVLNELGADPVDMPMGEVYSALAKGVIDGVIAPAETFASLHFHEVSSYFTELNVPRSAYPARAMSMSTWEHLSPTDQDVLEQSVAVWEHAIAELTRSSSERGYQLGHDAGIEFVSVSEADQMEFDRVYSEQARQSAERLAAQGYDALRVFDVARASVTPEGEVSCREVE